VLAKAIVPTIERFGGAVLVRAKVTTIMMEHGHVAGVAVEHAGKVCSAGPFIPFHSDSHWSKGNACVPLLWDSSRMLIPYRIQTEYVSTALLLCLRTISEQPRSCVFCADFRATGPNRHQRGRHP
jgi:hypothetical protein